MPLAHDRIADVLATVGLVAGRVPTGPVSFDRRDGSRGMLRNQATVGSFILDGSPPPPAAPMVLQVSRWDRLKDMSGVMTGFADMVREAAEARVRAAYLGDRHLAQYGDLFASLVISDQTDGGSRPERST